jgi:hypothetical protein
MKTRTTIFTFAVIMMVGTLAIGQNTRTGLLKTSLTLSKGQMLANNGYSTAYLHGFLEYFPSERVSLRGDSYLQVLNRPSDNLSTSFPLESNHTVFSGVMYHFLAGAFDPYVGLQPGLAYGRLGLPFTLEYSLSPVLGITGGANYYVGKYFNFFLSAQWVQGKATTKEIGAFSLNEIRVSGGLGFNLDVLRNK